MATSTAVGRVPLTSRQLAERGLVALVSALVSVAVVRFVLGLVVEIPAAFGPTQWGPALEFTAVAAVGATVVYAALDRYTEMPRRWFLC